LYIDHKKNALFNELLASIQGPPVDPNSVLWIGLRTFRKEYGDKMEKPPKPNESDIEALTEPLKSGETTRVVQFEECWKWALENWDRVIPEARRFLLDMAESTWKGGPMPVHLERGEGEHIRNEVKKSWPYNVEFIEAAKKLEGKRKHGK
jgi:hypothetical protein